MLCSCVVLCTFSCLQPQQPDGVHPTGKKNNDRHKRTAAKNHHHNEQQRQQDALVAAFISNCGARNNRAQVCAGAGATPPGFAPAALAEQPEQSGTARSNWRPRPEPRPLSADHLALLSPSLTPHTLHTLHTYQQVLADLIRLLPGKVHSYGACQHNKDAGPAPVGERAKQKEVRLQGVTCVCVRAAVCFLLLLCARVSTTTTTTCQGQNCIQTNQTQRNAKHAYNKHITQNTTNKRSACSRRTSLRSSPRIPLMRAT